MTDTPTTARPRDAAAFDPLTAVLFFGLPALLVIAALAIGPMEAMERLARVMRHLPPIWGH